MSLIGERRERDEARSNSNIIERLSQHFPEYNFDYHQTPVRSSYENLHISAYIRQSTRCVNGNSSDPTLTTHECQSCSSVTSLNNYVENIVVKVSKNIQRSEREYKQAQFVHGSTEDANTYFIRPLRLSRIPSSRSGESSMAASFFEAPSAEYLNEYANLNACFSQSTSNIKSCSTSLFLDFAIGSCAVLEAIHHRHSLVHGEIRPDAFHYDQNRRSVRLVNFGFGAMNFVNRLTNAGWTGLLSEIGIMYKLQFLAPEQTGRMAADPDMRTDTYSLGISLWTLLTAKLPFEGEEPLELIQSVLSQKLPAVQSLRRDISPAICKIIMKMTRKAMNDRYNSVSSAKHDFQEVKRLLEDDNLEALAAFEVAYNDVSPVFRPPTTLIGRKEEEDVLLKEVQDTLQELTAVHKQANKRRTSASQLYRNGFGASSETIHSSNETLSQSPRVIFGGRRSQKDDLATVPVKNSDPCSESVPQSTHLITICGERGMGKTFFLHHMQQRVRSNMLVATAQFERSNPQPLGPVLKLVATLFRQIFSESDVDTLAHHQIRDRISPFWPSLCAHLELPHWLMDSDSISPDDQSTTNQKSRFDRPNSRQTAGFVQILLEVLGVVAFQRCLCLCLDDIDHADEDSIDLVKAIIDVNLPLLILLTFKPESTRVQIFLDAARSSINISIRPFSESQVEQYVAEALRQSIRSCAPLASIVFDRTNGRPAYARDFLDQCYTAELIYFSWERRRWEMQLSKIAQCWPDTDDLRMLAEATGITRLQRLDQHTQAVLCWATVLGEEFSTSLLELICHQVPAEPVVHVPGSVDDVAGSIQLALSKFILQSTEEEDILMFADDKCYQAALKLCESYHRLEMHYIIACTMTKNGNNKASTTYMYQLAEHILEAVPIIKRVNKDEEKRYFIDNLLVAAEATRSTGTPKRGAAFCEAALALIEGEPWNNDFSFLHLKAADLFHLAGRTDRSLTVLNRVEENVDGLCKRAPAIVIRSRIQAAQRNGRAAYKIVTSLIPELELPLLPETMQECDDSLRQAHNDGMQSTMCRKHGTGMILAEAVMTSLWMEEVLPYSYAVALVNVGDDVRVGAYVALGQLFLSAIVLFRTADRSFSEQLREQALVSLSNSQSQHDVWSRGLVLRALLLGHLEVESHAQIELLTQALRSTASVSDKGFNILNVATIALLRFCASDDLPGLELFIQHSTMNVPDWQNDIQNGVLLICTRQLVRALCGKTQVELAETIFCDSEHDSATYTRMLDAGGHNFCKAIYNGSRLIAMNMFGYHRQAMEIGLTLMGYIRDCRCSPCLNAIFYHTALAISAVLRIEEHRDDQDYLLDVITQIRARIELIARSKTPVCQAWLLVIEAEIADDTTSLRLLNFAVEMVQGLRFTLDEAYCLELYANCLARMGAVSAVQQILHCCSATYERAGATAKARQVIQVYKMLTNTELSAQMPSPSNASSGSLVRAHSPTWSHHGSPVYGASALQHDRVDSFVAPTVENIDVDSMHGTESWLDGVEQEHESNAQLLKSKDKRAVLGTLDVIDLHSIISSSQAMSSELDIDRLLRTLTKIIADSTAAETCSIIVRSENGKGWTIAAMQSSKEDEMVDALPLEEIGDVTAKRIINYVLRFREQMFVHNTMENETINHVAPSSSTEKESSVICVPMLHSDTLLGSVYCQAPLKTFTDRTMTLVQLLVTQISISLHNALLFKKLDMASASNLTMIELQKETVNLAQESERKAKLAESRAIENLRLKEEAMQAKSMFLANVSHELRTPLNGVIGMAEILSGTELTSRQTECATSIKVCADSLLNIINDILDFSKLEAGKMQISNMPLNVSQKFKEVVGALRTTHNKADLQTIDDVQIDPNLVVMADSVRLQQVLMNLMSNAYKFTQQGKITVHASIQSMKDDYAGLKVMVTDTGIGISPEQQKKLFLPFTQADASTARSYGGTGLGLSICKAIIETAMNGKIWLESAPGAGTKVCYVVQLKIVSNSNGLRSAASERASLAEAEEHTAGRKILHMPRTDIKVCIAEDNHINRKIAINYVKKLGFKYEAYEDGQQAVDALTRAKDFDLVLMDVQMPVLDGYSATREIRKSEVARVQTVIIIAMTASTIKGDREKCFEAGMDAYVAKPVKLKTLEDAIDAFIAETPDHGMVEQSTSIHSE